MLEQYATYFYLKSKYRFISQFYSTYTLEYLMTNYYNQISMI